MKLFEMLMNLMMFLAILQVARFFFVRSYIGKSIISTFKLIRQILKFNYMTIKNICKFIGKSIEKMESKKENLKPNESKPRSKKVVNLDDYRD